VDIAIYLVDGNIVKFEQEDAAKAAGLLDHVHPDKVFSQPVLVIAGLYSVTAIPSASIVRVDVNIAHEPGWSFHFNAKDVVAISEQEFGDWQSRQSEWETRLTPREPGDLYITYGRIEMRNGQNLYVEVKVEADLRMPLDRSLMIRNLFSAHSLHARRREGGAVIINPQNIVRYTFFPGPSETPPNAWPAHHKSG